jgi:serine/threonine protein kinase
MQEVFLAAVERHRPEEWEAFLDGACGADDELRRQVNLLLKAHREAGSVPGAAAAEPDQTGCYPAPTEAPGTFVGPYKLLEQIGEGGMGIVYMAEQEQPVRRKVALKIIKPGMDSAQVIARFDAERHALALMDQQNIARVLDAGTTASGRPYFVMELVKGVPITKYCDDNHLTPRERLELFVPVCLAIQHAHQKGIIHRDIKPSNVLVAPHDGKPVVKVIDFGVAKATGQRLTDKTIFTGFGALVGTPEYMSPEQAEVNNQDIDTRSDVYSLGVLLYELLTGSTPLTRQRMKEASLLEVLRLIREEDPPRPSTRLSATEELPSVAANRGLEPKKLSGLLRGELDWIVMKALDKDRNRRYETANGLAMDVQRYLADEAVLAHPPSVWYRLQKFARKHRKLLWAAGAFVLLLTAGTVVSAWQAMRATAARDGEAEQRRQAEKSEAESKAVLKFFLEKVLSAARSKGQEGGLGKDATIRAALDQAEPEIAKFFADQPLAEASIRNTLGVTYWYLNETNLALRQQERALALRRQELGPQHDDTVGIINDLALVFISQGKYDEARKHFEEVATIRRHTLGTENQLTLRSLNNLANVLAQQGRFEEASKLSEETLQIRRRLLGPEDLFTLRSAYNLAIMWHYLGRFEDAGRLFDETLQIQRRVLGPQHQDTLRVMHELGELMLDLGRLDEAEKLCEETLQGQRQVLGPTHAETLVTMGQLADVQRARGRLAEARKTAEEAVQQHRRILSPEHPFTLAATAVLADVLRDQGQLSEARKLYEETLASERRVLGPKTPEMQKLMNGFAWMLATAAESKYREPARAVDLATEVVQHAPNFPDKWTTLGVACYRAGDWKNAIAALEKSEALAPGRFAGINGFFLALAHWQLGEKEKARQLYDRAAQWMDKNEPKNENLRRFRAEAVELLEPNKKK